MSASPSSSRKVSILLCASLLAGALACVAPPLAPLDAARTTASLEADEQALWKESRALQYQIESSGLLFDDPALDAYLGRVLERVTPSEMRAAGLAPRVEVVSDLNIDGYSFANGVVYIHTALLARMSDETQLATMLSRELAHILGRNALRAKRERRARADQLAWIGVGTSVVQNGDQIKLLAQAAAITTAVGFDHSVETIADKRGLEILDEAGYAVGDTPAWYESTLAYLAEVHGQGIWGWAPFTPPLQVTARIAGMKSLIAAEYVGQTASRAPLLEAAAFRRTLHPATLRQTELELAAGLFVSAEATARLATASGPRDAQAWFLLGRALEGQRSKPLAGRSIPSIQSVREGYQQALSIDPRNADARRSLGMSFYRQTGTSRSRQDSEAALQHFRRYLSVSPDARDRSYVEGYVSELEAETR